MTPKASTSAEVAFVSASTPAPISAGSVEHCVMMIVTASRWGVRQSFGKKRRARRSTVAIAHVRNAANMIAHRTCRLFTSGNRAKEDMQRAPVRMIKVWPASATRYRASRMRCRFIEITTNKRPVNAAVAPTSATKKSRHASTGKLSYGLCSSSSADCKSRACVCA